MTDNKPRYWVIIPAAGSGSRMQQEMPKQYLQLCGTTMLQHTLEVFNRGLPEAKILVCLAANDKHFGQLDIPDAVCSTIGGASRAESVLNGLQALDAQANDWVLVHDAARPCLNHELLTRLLKELKEDDVGGILAVRSKDTLKQSTDQQRIEATIDRSLIWQAQTPQMFRFGLLQESLSKALAGGADITDEASAMEWAGHQPKLVEGDAHNLKITTADDLLLAEFLLSSKGSTIET